MIVLPRSWFKSSMASYAYPIWRAIDNCNVRILLVQNSFSNAKKKVLAVKTAWETNPLLRVLFPELLPDGSRPWSADCLTLNRKITDPEGTLEPAGTGTAVTSRHYDEILEDDTVAPDYDSMTGEIQQPTAVEIEKAIGFHKMCHPLLVHPTESVISVIGTRWANEDLIGWIMKHSLDYDVMCRSAYENAHGDPADPEQGGRPVWERFNARVLEELRTNVGPLMFAMLYLNSPSSSVSQVFKRSYIRYYENLPNGLLYCTTVDPAPAEVARTSDPDPTAIVTSAIKPSTGEVFVVHYDLGRFDPGETIERLFAHYDAYHPMLVRVESVAYQSTLCYWIRQKQVEQRKLFHVEPVPNARVSKAARILGMEPWFATGRVRIRTEQSELERQLLGFDPKRESLSHDDVIDALSMQVDFWSRCHDQAKDNALSVKANDPFSGLSTINELLDRAKLTRSYPYDIGHMAARLEGKLPRTDYVACPQN